MKISELAKDTWTSDLTGIIWGYKLPGIALRNAISESFLESFDLAADFEEIEGEDEDARGARWHIHCQNNTDRHKAAKARTELALLAFRACVLSCENPNDPLINDDGTPFELSKYITVEDVGGVPTKVLKVDVIDIIGHGDIAKDIAELGTKLRDLCQLAGVKKNS